MKQEGESACVPLGHDLTMSSLLPETCLWGQLAEHASPPALDALLSENDQTAAPSKWIDYACGLFCDVKYDQTWSLSSVSNEDTPLVSGHVFKHALAFLCKVPKQTEVVIRHQVIRSLLELTKTMCG